MEFQVLAIQNQVVQRFQSSGVFGLEALYQQSQEMTGIVVAREAPSGLWGILIAGRSPWSGHKNYEIRPVQGQARFSQDWENATGQVVEVLGSGLPSASTRF